MVAEDAPQVFDNERYIDHKIPGVNLDGFDYQYTALFDAEKAGQPNVRPQAMKAVRVRGGYFFSPGRTGRRRR
jgi:hypothetical protein